MIACMPSWGAKDVCIDEAVAGGVGIAVKSSGVDRGSAFAFLEMVEKARDGGRDDVGDMRVPVEEERGGSLRTIALGFTGAMPVNSRTDIALICVSV